MTRPAAVPVPVAHADPAHASSVREILALTARSDVISFAGGLPAPELFDADGLRAAYDHVLATAPRRVLQYSTTEGDPALRTALAERLSSHALPTLPDDLLVTSGSQQALALTSMALLTPGDTVLVESPTYLAALQCFASGGARVVPVPCDEDGVDPVALAGLAAAERPKLLYVVPNFQNPTGRTLSVERRRAVAEVAAHHGLWIVEDDPYGELRFHGTPLPWIASLDSAADRTVLLGSLSKIMSPGMRLGWLRAPAALRRACATVKQATDLHCSTVDQAAAARYLTHADFDAHLARVRAAYRVRRDALLDGLPSALPHGSTWNRPDGGMFVWVRLPGGHDATTLLPRAVAHDVAYVPGAPFFAGPADPATLRISFTEHPAETIREGLTRLAKIFG
ncbi:PLP-dependent aminotransferase family protein [Streptomyces sp. NPDC021098]|uniref:aminotransferase-like domain-containing protein n=1 Tax=unclassified Streptomyces TaxID=2593676 RepID=UPI00379EE44C